MDKKFSGSESPLLRNLILIQIAAILSSSIGIFLAYRYVSESNFNAAVAKLRLEVSSELSAREDKWRAWRQLGLNDALQVELDTFRTKLKLESLKVIEPGEVKTNDPLRNVNREAQEFKIHPDEIKSLKTGQCVFVVKDKGVVRKIRVPRPVNLIAAQMERTLVHVETRGLGPRVETDAATFRDENPKKPPEVNPFNEINPEMNSSTSEGAKV